MSEDVGWGLREVRKVSIALWLNRNGQLPLPLEDRTEYELPSFCFEARYNGMLGCDLCDQADCPILCAKHISVTAILMIDSPKALIGFSRILVTLSWARQSATALLNNSFVNSVVPSSEEKRFLTKSRRNYEEWDGGSDTTSNVKRKWRKPSRSQCW